MQEKKFTPFLDDIWGEGTKLLEYLGVPSLTNPSDSKSIVTSRDHRALQEMGVTAKGSIVKMEDLVEDESQQLFFHHYFPYNKENRRKGIEYGTTKLMFFNCGGIPLIIKSVGREMVGIPDPRDREFVVQRLLSTNNQDLRRPHYDPLR